MAGPHKNPRPLYCFTFYRRFDVDVMKFLKVRGSAVSHKQYRSSAKQMHCRGTLKLIQEYGILLKTGKKKSDVKVINDVKLCMFLEKLPKINH